MISEEDFDFTEQQLEKAELEINDKWGSEIEGKLDRFLEYQIMDEVDDVNSTIRQRVMIYYKPTKCFEEFYEEFKQLEEIYQKRNEEFEVDAFDEFESLVNQDIESLIEDLKQEQAFEEHLTLGEAVVANLTPAQIQKFSQQSNIVRLEADKPLRLELDQSSVTVGLANARTQGIVGTGRGVIIAVLDGEVDINHPDLKGRVVHKRNYTSEPWGNPHPHGTHVAGIIAGNGSQYKGMAPEAVIWNYKLLPSETTQSGEGFKGADAIEDVIKDMKEGVKVANCSWGVPTELDGTNIWAKTAERAAKLGLVLVKSAGNNGSEPRTLTSPADAFGDVIVVGASSHDGTQVMPFSSRGPTADNRPKPDILAPGEQIVSTVPGGSYQKMSGTSMASPHIAGISALLLERNPKLEPWQIKKILMESAKPLESTTDPNVQGKGLVDVVKALQMAAQPASEEKQIIYTSVVKQRKLLEQLNIAVKNTSKEVMQGVKASLVSPTGDINVTAAEQDYGNLRIGADVIRNFEIEVSPNGKPSQYNLSLKLNYTTSSGQKKTDSYQIIHQVPSLAK
ncbi:S8 family serine peptidase [Nostoc sp. FACHB-152]|uniref:S8 family serine peptidase n=1 Tax=Nostoc sp. FACHB-152 TaxID=2692837 RepID=UPI001685250F|nr:S8 family serine peptidase [Nostoc sp. FACHB-152]MBD2452092.1 S8 family serine peptidase [Nostoc sp. FACHB-152]